MSEFFCKVQYLFYFPLVIFFLTSAAASASVPYLVFPVLIQVTRWQNYKAQLFFLGTRGLINLGFLKVPFILLPIIWEFCLFLTYL